jgi:SAM-dependent MidA family methyltransferase
MDLHHIVQNSNSTGTGYFLFYDYGFSSASQKRNTGNHFEAILEEFGRKGGDFKM